MSYVGVDIDMKSTFKYVHMNKTKLDDSTHVTGGIYLLKKQANIHIQKKTKH